jgi:hypothetical protein
MCTCTLVLACAGLPFQRERDLQKGSQEFSLTNAEVTIRDHDRFLSNVERARMCVPKMVRNGLDSSLGISGQF